VIWNDHIKKTMGENCYIKGSGNPKKEHIIIIIIEKFHPNKKRGVHFCYQLTGK
jgi:hypothetical protein